MFGLGGRAVVGASKLRHQTVAAGSDAFFALGPFAAGGLLVEIGLTFSSSTVGWSEVGVVLHGSGEASAATLAAGVQLIDVSDVSHSGANAVRLELPVGAPYTLNLSINRLIGPVRQWVHMAVVNGGTTSLYVLAAVASWGVGGGGGVRRARRLGVVALPGDRVAPGTAVEPFEV